MTLANDQGRADSYTGAASGPSPDRSFHVLSESLSELSAEAPASADMKTFGKLTGSLPYFSGLLGSRPARSF
jgi:hypothetical protein